MLEVIQHRIRSNSILHSSYCSRRSRTRMPGWRNGRISWGRAVIGSAGKLTSSLDLLQHPNSNLCILQHHHSQLTYSSGSIPASLREVAAARRAVRTSLAPVNRIQRHTPTQAVLAFPVDIEG